MNIARGRPINQARRVVIKYKNTAVQIASWLRNIDGDITNNARFVDDERDTRPSAVLATRWTFYVEEVLRTYVGMGR